MTVPTPEPLRILLVEDDEEDYQLTRVAVNGMVGYDATLEWAASYDAGLALVRERTFDAVLLDFQLGAHTGFEFIAEAFGEEPAVPVILLTGHSTREVEIAAATAGSVDYLEKSNTTPALLERSLRYSIRQVRRANRLRESQKSLLRRIEAERTLLNTVLRDLPVGIIVAETRTRRIALCNPKMEEIWRRSIPVGTRLADYQSWGPALALKQWPLVRALEHGERVDAERMEIERGDGTRGIVEVSSAPVFGRDNEISAAVSTTVDVTDREEAHAQLQQLEAHFRQAQKVEAIGQLAGGVAHDFNNLLTVIQSYSESLLAQLPPHDRARGDVAEIASAAKRAADLTRQLLAFSRKQVLQPQIVSPIAVVAALEPMLKRLIGEHIEIATRMPPNAPPVLVDPSQLDQVIVNLVVNARDAMPDGGTVVVSVGERKALPPNIPQHNGAECGPFVEITVTDTGVGMTPEIRDRIFDPFFTTKEQGRGTGMGLATVFGVVEQSGGYVWVDSAPGEGSTFHVCLPAATEAERPARAAEAAQRELKGHERVLVVEDDDALRRLAVRALNEGGYMVIEARHAAEAIALLAHEREPVDLLVTDLVMPGMNGRELAEKLQSEIPSLRVLYMSGYTDDEVLRRALGSGDRVTNAFLQKPFTLPTFTGAVRRMLDGTMEEFLIPPEVS